MLEFLWKFDWESVTIIVIASVIIYALDFVLFELYARRQDRRSEANEKRRLRKIRQLHGDLVGEIGSALTALKPSGTIQINESTYEARSQGAFIEKDSRVRVIDVRNGVLVVEACSHFFSGTNDNSIIIESANSLTPHSITMHSVPAGLYTYIASGP